MAALISMKLRAFRVSVVRLIEAKALPQRHGEHKASQRGC
jgi:hypothetical protein